MHLRCKVDITSEASMSHQSQAEKDITSFTKDQRALRFSSKSDKAGMLIPEDGVPGPQLKNPTWQGNY